MVRYEGPGSERFPQPTEEQMEECDVITIRLSRPAKGVPKRSADMPLPGCKNVRQSAKEWRSAGPAAMNSRGLTGGRRSRDCIATPVSKSSEPGQ